MFGVCTQLLWTQAPFNEDLKAYLVCCSYVGIDTMSLTDGCNRNTSVGVPEVLHSLQYDFTAISLLVLAPVMVGHGKGRHDKVELGSGDSPQPCSVGRSFLLHEHSRGVNATDGTEANLTRSEEVS